MRPSSDLLKDDTVVEEFASVLPRLSKFLPTRKFLLLHSFLIVMYSAGVEPLELIGVSVCCYVLE